MTANETSTTAAWAPEVVRERARRAYRDSIAAGGGLSGKALGERFGRGERWGRERIAETRATLPNPSAQRKCAAPVVQRPRPVAPVLRKAASAVRRGTGRATVYVITRVRVAATHERTRTTLRWAIRNAVVYVATGLWVLLRRVWEPHTQSRYERMMRQAELAGDMDRLVDWEQRAEHARGAPLTGSSAVVRRGPPGLPQAVDPGLGRAALSASGTAHVRRPGHMHCTLRTVDASCHPGRHARDRHGRGRHSGRKSAGAPGGVRRGAGGCRVEESTARRFSS